MNKSTKRSKRRQDSGLGHLILGGGILCGTAAMVLLGRLEVTWPAVAALLAGPVLGILLFRFGSRHAWVTLAGLFGAVVVAVALLANLDEYGPAGVAWMGGLVGGSNIGVAWRTAAERRKAAAPGTRRTWQVDGRGFATVAEARQAAETALRRLDGKERWRLTVARGAARFEVAGGPAGGLVCHRSANAADEQSWAVLVRGDRETAQPVEVPMGRLKANMPAKLVQDADSASAALSDFFRAPGAVPPEPVWERGAEAEGTRLAVN